ncbi:MAG TPA: CBS domain-containing protein [Anaerolineae bacterium]
MTEQLLVRDVMRIGVPTCKLEDAVDAVAAQMLTENTTALVVLDEEGHTAGWINERALADAYRRIVEAGEGAAAALTAEQIMIGPAPELPVDVPLTAAIQLMADQGVDHLFFLHRAGGRAWPASVLSLRDAVRALAGPEYIQQQGAGAPRPNAMDLFRQRYKR